MPTWNANQYLKFSEERTRPCRDLVAAIRLIDVKTIIDLGCGPGNSTIVLAEKWPDASITGLDNSMPMIDVARRERPRYRWLACDIVDWASTHREQLDLVFSNAALQWVDDHPSLFPKLMERVSPRGALALQIPADLDALPHRLMRQLAPPGLHVKEWYAHTPESYYRILAPHASQLDIWQTEYQHVMDGTHAIVEWYKGSALRSFLEVMRAEEQEKFLAEFADHIGLGYAEQPDGKVLFPFKRLFIVAYKA